MDLALLIPILGILLLMIPVAGLTLLLTIRFAVRPLVETLADALRDSREGGSGGLPTEELRALSEQVETLAHEVRELRSGRDFDRKLLGEADEPARFQP